MNQAIKLFTTLLFTTALIGCELESNSDEAATKEMLPVEATWKLNGNLEEFLFIDNEAYVNTFYLSEFACYSSNSFTMSNLTNEFMVLNIDNAPYELPYSINENILSIGGAGGQTYTRSDLTRDQLASCDNPTATGNISIEYKFDHLPESILINHENGDDSTAAYMLYIQMDLDESNSISDGDLSFRLYEDFNESKSNETISLSQLKSEVYVTRDNGDRETLISDFTFEVLQDLNTIIITAPKSAHKALSEITTITPMYINTFYYDENLDRQFDYFPASGYASDVTNELIDAQADVTGNYSTTTVLDLISIKVIISE